MGGMYGGDNSIMGKLKSAISGVRMTHILVALFILLVIIVIVIMYNKKISQIFSPGYKPNSENIYEGASGSGQEAEIILFYVDWCPHCKTAKPEWEQVKAEFNSKTINGYTVVFTEINCTNESPEVEKMVSTYKIEGYPTIKLLKNGQVIEFDAKPTKAALTQFLNTAL